jgi:hypothetical protein
MDAEPAASSGAPSNAMQVRPSKAKVRHYCAVPSCLREIHHAKDASIITAKLQNEHPVLQTWVKTIKKTVADEDGNAIVIRHDVYDRWHRSCQRSFYPSKPRCRRGDKSVEANIEPIDDDDITPIDDDATIASSSIPAPSLADEPRCLTCWSASNDV